MSVAAFRSEDALAALRVDGGATASFKADRAITRIALLAEYGGYRLKFPDCTGGALEAVVVNTGGGVAGGDRVQFDIQAGAASKVIVATATAERIYRSRGANSAIDVRLDVEHGSTLAWLPQATILFSGARLQRRFDVDVAGQARLLMAETTVFGREASGEIMGTGFLHDRWRVRRDGALIFADETRLDGDISALQARPALAAAVRGVALLLCVAPDVEEKRHAVRVALAGGSGETGVSAWNGMLVVRVLASRLDVLQSALRRAIDALQIASVPQVWSN